MAFPLGHLIFIFLPMIVTCSLKATLQPAEEFELVIGKYMGSNRAYKYSRGNFSENTEKQKYEVQGKIPGLTFRKENTRRQKILEMVF